MSADSIDLNVLVKDVVVYISLKKTDRVDEMFDIVSKEEDMKLLLEHVTKSSCKFRKLQQPILPEYDDDLDIASEATVDKCKDMPKKAMQASHKINRYFRSDLEDEESIHVVMQLPDVIKLNVLVQKAVVSIDINNERTVKDIYEVSSNKAPTEVRELLQHVTKSSCIFHKLEQPILPEYDDGTGIVSEATVNKCKVKPKQLMQATEKIKKFFQSKPEDQERVHVLMELPDKIYRQIKLKVLIDNAVVSIDISNKRNVQDIYGTVSKQAPQRIKLLLGHVEVGDCQLHNLKQPILIQRDVRSKAVTSDTIEQCKTADAELMELDQEIHDYFDSNPEAGRIHVVIQLPDKIYGEICLNVLIYNALVAININNNGVVKNIYEKAKALLPEDVKRMTRNLETSKLIFEQIDPPIMFQPGSDDAHVSDETARECQEAEKKRMRNGVQIVNYFAYDSLSEFHIHVVIRPPDVGVLKVLNHASFANGD
ncbi:hypothetical protein M378DRAFT_28303 [Amanita muscaria Koide BX008]|uniref:Uncharacterized protein n=1 Tax=Amanita muscaria (strain Koide BX008) TaxID=946122 RepID=A0A0C2SRA7_AMAMK|nr:hypothetical protein M378DRAFT_28303 [Amanita muscaria Koide BX008]